MYFNIVFFGFQDVIVMGRSDGLSAYILYNLLVIIALSCQHVDETGGVDESFIVDVHVVEGVIAFFGGEFFAEWHQSVPQPLIKFKIQS